MTDRRVIHSFEVRLKALELIQKGHGEKSIGSLLGISKNTARDFIIQYRQGRLLGLRAMGEKNKVYSFETKLAAVKEVLSGASTGSVTVEFEITNRSMLNKWIKKYREGGPDALKSSVKGRPRGDGSVRQETQEEKIARLEFEIEALKNCRLWWHRSVNANQSVSSPVTGAKILDQSALLFLPFAGVHVLLPAKQTRH